MSLSGPNEYIDSVGNIINAEELPTVANDTDAGHDILIGASRLKMYNGSGYKYFTTSAITKQIDANWVAGDDAGGFPSGLSLAADTGYYIFLIGKPDGTVDAGFDTSATAANLLADATGYTYYRAIWWVITDSSSNIIRFVQINGDTCEYTESIADLSDTGGSNGVDETATVSCPPNSKGTFKFDIGNSNDAYGVQGFLNDKEMLSNIKGVGAQVSALVDNSSQLTYTLTWGTGGWKLAALKTQGWRKKW